MNFNTFLLRLGMNPDDFVNAESEPIKMENGYIYSVSQRTDKRKCPHCGSTNAIINDHDTVEINCSDNEYIRDVLRIRKVRFKCKDCGKTFTPPITGIDPYSKISSQTLQLIYNDFTKMMSFKQIADKYGLTEARIIQIFDEKFIFVPRRPFTKVMCIDEIKFDEEPDQKYCCVLYSFDNRHICDIIKNRQLPYLKEYFETVPERERDKVKFFVSDMYDAYATVCRKYFKNAVHIVDLFHVIVQLTRAVNQIRTRVMKSTQKGSVCYTFMKKNWKLFLCRTSDIPDKLYTHKATGVSYHFDDLIIDCVKLDKDFLNAYNIMQDLYKYDQRTNFKEAVQFVEFISKRLLDSGNDVLISVGKTYNKWKVPIANGLARSQNKTRITNAIAESLNNLLQTIIKTAYGYHNFQRFRKRALIILTYKNIT